MPSDVLTSASSPPVTKLSTTVALLGSKRPGATAPAPAPRRANAAQKAWKSFTSLAHAAASKAFLASSSVGALGVSLYAITRSSFMCCCACANVSRMLSRRSAA